MTKILFEAKKHTKFSEKFTKLKEMYDSEIYIHDNIIKIVPKKRTKPLRFIEIREIEEIEELIVLIDYNHMRYQIYEIFLHTGNSKYIAFFSGTEWHERAPENFLKVLSEQFGIKINLKAYDKIRNFIAPHDELTYDKIVEALNIPKDELVIHLKKMKRDGYLEAQILPDKIEIHHLKKPKKKKISKKEPPKSRTLVLRCPRCKEPLDLLPPCECENCGVYVEFMT